MTLADTIILLLIATGLVAGYKRGLVAQVASLAAVLLGAAACLLWGGEATLVFKALVPSSSGWLLASITVGIAARVALFLLVSLTVRVIALFVKSIVKAISLGKLDRLGGSALMTAKLLLAASLALNAMFVLNPRGGTFATRHALGNKPFEATLDFAPWLLGASKMPSDSLKALQACDSIKTDSLDYEKQ